MKISELIHSRHVEEWMMTDNVMNVQLIATVRP